MFAWLRKVGASVKAKCDTTSTETWQCESQFQWEWSFWHFVFTENNYIKMMMLFLPVSTTILLLYWFLVTNLTSYQKTAASALWRLHLHWDFYSWNNCSAPPQQEDYCLDQFNSWYSPNHCGWILKGRSTRNDNSVLIYTLPVILLNNWSSWGPVLKHKWLHTA